MAHSYHPFVARNRILTSLRVLILISVLSCKKGDAVKQHTPFELLTQKEWLLSSTGFDDNKNGRIDVGEDTIRDCDKDNTLQFNNNGSGWVKDNGVTCGGPAQNVFTWVLDNDSTISIQGNVVRILKLTHNEFSYSPKLDGLVVDYIISYRRCSFSDHVFIK